MSEKPEEELDLGKIQLWDTGDFKKVIKRSLNDYNGEISYMNGKTIKIRDFIDVTLLALCIEGKIRCDYLKELTCSLKKPTTS